jgi:hypothetical protein
MDVLLLFVMTASARPVLELAQVEADPCGFVQGEVRARPSLLGRRVVLSFDDVPVGELRLARGEESAPFVVFVGTERLGQLTASWWFVDSESAWVGEQAAGPALVLRGASPIPQNELQPLQIQVDPRCDVSQLTLAVHSGAQQLLPPLTPQDSVTSLPLELPVGEHTLWVTLSAGEHPIASEEWSLQVTPPCLDLDGDGHFSCRDGDCDDRDPSVHPGATERDRNGKDEDCDGLDGRDMDKDGWVARSSGGEDCDDAQAQIHPGASVFPDRDGDGVPAIRAVDFDCDGELDAFSGTLDCNEQDPAIPRAEDPTPTGVDEDCDGLVDEGTVVFDDDGDGLSEVEGDCDDGDDAVHPGARERPDCRDNDCDGELDEGVTRAARDDSYEPNDPSPAEIPGAQYRSGFFGGKYVSSDVVLAVVSRDVGDIERYHVYAHDGAFDSFHVSVRVVGLGDGVRYQLTVHSPDGDTHAAVLSERGDSLYVPGTGGNSDSGTYLIELVPITFPEELDWCPLQLEVSTG